MAICLNRGRNGITTWNNSLQGQRNEICWNSIHLPAFTGYLSCLEIRHVQSLTCPVTWSSFPVAVQTCFFPKSVPANCRSTSSFLTCVPSRLLGRWMCEWNNLSSPYQGINLAVSLGGQTLSWLPFPFTVTRFITCYTWPGQLGSAHLWRETEGLLFSAAGLVFPLLPCLWCSHWITDQRKQERCLYSIFFYFLSHHLVLNYRCYFIYCTTF